MAEILETERLILRHWAESDAGNMLLYVGPITGWPPHKSIDESRYVIDNILNGE